MKRISLTEVIISGSAMDRVRRVLESGRIGQSQVVEEFESLFSEWAGTKHAIAVSSGTMADTIALAVLKNMDPKKNSVLVPALTFAAHVNSIIYNNLTPVFVDVTGDLVMDEFKAQSNTWKNTLCAFPAHLLGNYANMVEHREIPIIEDACEAMGSVYHGKKLGTFGKMGTFSFFPSHAMTTGEGGMIVTNDEKCAELARRLRNHGKNSGKDFHFDVIGFNGKMTSLQAALGIEALGTIDEDVARRRANFIAIGGKEMRGLTISPHAFPVICGSEAERDAMMQDLVDNGIECRNLFSCLPTQELAYAKFGYKIGSFPMAEYIGRCGLYVPCHQHLDEEGLLRIKEIVHGLHVKEEKTEKATVLR